MAGIARALGKDDDVSRYQILSEEAREAFIKRFVHDDGTIEGGTQTSYVLALHFNLLPEELRLERGRTGAQHSRAGESS